MPRNPKVEYVLGQKQTRSHKCHWPECTIEVPPAKWGCLRHWRKLPKRFRDRIWASYEPGQEELLTPSIEYLEVAADIQEWIRANG